MKRGLLMIAIPIRDTQHVRLSLDPGFTTTDNQWVQYRKHPVGDMQHARFSVFYTSGDSGNIPPGPSPACSVISVKTLSRTHDADLKSRRSALKDDKPFVRSMAARASIVPAGQ